MAANPTVVFGAGGHGRELRFQLDEAGFEVLAFVDEINCDRSVDRLQVMRPDQARERFPEALWHVAMGNIAARVRIVADLIGQGISLGSFISPGALVSPRARIDAPAQIFANTVVSEGVHIESFCIVNFGCVISHDARLGKFTYLSPGVLVTGNVHIDEQAWLGVGVSLRNGSTERPLRVGREAVVGAGACVVQDVPPRTTVAGVPATRLPKSV